MGKRLLAGLSSFVTFTVLAGCGGQISGEETGEVNSPLCRRRDPRPTTARPAAKCVKLEGDRIGKIQALQGLPVVLTGWRTKDGNPREFVGFSYVAWGGGVTYTVKAGAGTYEGKRSPWLQPDGTAPNVGGISDITFCPAVQPTPPPTNPCDGADGADGAHGLPGRH